MGSDGSIVVPSSGTLPAMAMPPAAAAPAQAAPAPVSPGVPAGVSTAAAVGELNHLANLIGAQPATETFKLENLFGADIFAKGDGQGPGAEIIQIDGTAPSAHRSALDQIRQQMDGLTLADQQPPDDLLDLMDRA